MSRNGRIPISIPESTQVTINEGVIIAKQNRGLGRTFTIRRMVQGIGVEQIFLFNSPKIISVVRKQMSKVRRSKLYFLRQLTGKSSRLKQKL